MKRESKKIILLQLLGLLLICLLSYGIIAGKLGFFLDDWYIIWTYLTFGAAKFVEFFEGDRPLFSMVYRVFIPIIKDNPLGWQYFAILTKWLAAVSFWQLLRLILPEKNWFTYSVAALFAVYPGFKFHYFSVMYAQNYFLLTIYFLSYIFMILGMKKTKLRVVFVVFGMVFQFIGIAPMELYYGLELVRPVLIFFLLSNKEVGSKVKFWKVIYYWLPYLVVFIGFTLFRVIFSHLYSYQVSLFDQLMQNPIKYAIDLIIRVLRGVFDSFINVWIDIFRSFAHIDSLEQSVFAALLVCISFFTAYFFIHRSNNSDIEKESRRLSLGLQGVGVYSVLAAMIPVVVGGFSVGLAFETNRFLLPLSIGVSIATVAFIEFTVRAKRIKNVIIAILLALSIGANYLNGLEFKKAWDEQKDFFAQLTWRAPQIEPGTVLLSTVLPFDLYFSGTSLTAPLNLIYAPDLRENPIPFQMILTATPQMNTMPELLPNQVINRRQRVFSFVGNTSDAIVVYSPQKGCLKLLYSDTDFRAFSSDRYADLWKSIIPLSDLDRIDTEASRAEMPTRYFGIIRQENWCYYYQQAALAEQRHEWDTIISTYQEAEEKGYHPEDESEWLPLIRTYLYTGNSAKAIEISDSLMNEDEFTHFGLCSLWQNYRSSVNEDEAKSVDPLLKRWRCE
ncbi:MAG: hypothetical protein WBJ23_02685 [Anaerolineaceae bacterium]|jgi:hypothetical protein|nr:hypothetical protein [Chloroflexota bacterium]